MYKYHDSDESYRAGQGRSYPCSRPSGGIKVKGVKFQIGSHLADVLVTIVRDNAMIALYAVSTGEFFIEHPWPEPGIRYVRNGKPRGPRKNS